jgi:microsomal dipeptidase-like Zn-dependent dipeptidase
MRRVSARFLNIHHDSDWRTACLATPRNIMGAPHRLPKACVAQATFGLPVLEHFGQWDVADSSCLSTLSPPPQRGGTGNLSSSAPLEGFADIHVHQMGNLGFGGSIIWGGAFGDPAQVLGPIPPEYKRGHDATEAATHRRVHVPAGLKWADAIIRTLETLTDAFAFDLFGHGEDGWPSFTSWPNYNIWMHQQVYQDWLFRAYQGGLRLMVMLAVNSEDDFGRGENHLGSIGKATFQRAKNRGRTANDMEALEWQVRAAYEMQHRIDVEAGGPGRGWYRIVRDPQEASTAIQEGRLAVILGTELQHLFNCDIDRPVCSRQTVIEGLNRLEAMGVNYVFPVHHKWNQFGGPAIFQPLNSGPTERCPDLAYRCSSMGLSELGGFLISELTTRGMLIDTEHFSRKAFADAMSILEQRRYPVLAGHVVPRDLQMDDEQQTERARTSHEITRIVSVGGIVAPMLATPAGEYAPSPGTLLVPLPIRCIGDSGGADQWANAYLLLRKLGSDGGPLSPVAIGSDWNGLAGSPGPVPRHNADQSCEPRKTHAGHQRMELEPKITYPIELPDQLVPAQTGPTKTLHEFHWPAKGRLWDYNSEGVGHIGMIPDFIENLRVLGLTVADLEPFYRSARGVVDLWAVARKREVPEDRHYLRWVPQSPFDVLWFHYADPSRDVQAHPPYSICRTRDGQLLGFLENDACHPVAGPLPQHAPAPATIAVYDDGRCLDVHGGSLDAGASVEQMPCGSDVRQEWALLRLPSGSLSIVNQNSGQCLAISRGRVSEGARAVQEPCTGEAEQQWWPTRVGNTFHLVADHSGLCLEVRKQSRDNGAAIQQAVCTTASNQLWTIDALRADDYEKLYQADKWRIEWLAEPTDVVVPVTVDDEHRHPICRSRTPEPWLGVVDGDTCTGATYGGAPKSSRWFEVLYQAR